jgi:hypothetical protein
MDVKEFIKNYADVNEGLISFAWNREHGDGLRDSNMPFRQEVIQHLLSDMSVASPQLLRHLFRAETKLSKEAWGVNLWVHSIAQQMLLDGGDPYVEEFLRGKLRSFDTMLECSRVQIPRILAKQFADFCRISKESAKTEKDHHLWEHGEEFFSQRAD